MGSIVHSRTAAATPIYSAAINDFLASANAAAARTALALGSGDAPTFKGLTVAQGTLTNPVVGLDLTATWNDGADTFTAIRQRVTDTASASGSLLMDLGTAALGSVFAVKKSGVVEIKGAGDSGNVTTIANEYLYLNTGSSVGNHAVIQATFNKSTALARFTFVNGLNGQDVSVENIGADFGARFGYTGAQMLLRFGGSVRNRIIVDAGDLHFGNSAGTDYMTLKSTGLEVAGQVVLPGGVIIASGSGTPEGALTAPVGSTYHRTDGGTGTATYVKESGTGDTGWIAK